MSAPPYPRGTFANRDSARAALFLVGVLVGCIIMLVAYVLAS